MELDSVHHIDLLTLCGMCDPQSIDMILCDLPYGTTACSWDKIIPLEPMWEQFKRAIKPRGAIVLTASQPFTTKLIASNIHMFKYEWIWVKTKPSDHINAKNKPMKRHENVLVFSNGTTANKSPNRMTYIPQGITKINERSYRPNRDVGLSHILGQRPSHKKEWVQELTNYPSSILTFANPNNDTIHPTQKPVPLFEYLIRTYTQEGEIVLDPCVGSGTTAIACINTGRRYIVGDSDVTWTNATEQRLKNTNPYQHRELDNGTTQLSIWGIS